MPPTTKRITQRWLLRVSLLLALLTAAAGIGQSQTASPCLGNQLSAHREADDQAMGGRVSVYYSFKNNSESPCTLKGSPGVILIDRAGRQIKTRVGKGADSSAQPKAVTLEPGGKAFFQVNYSSCAVSNSFSDQKSRCRSSAKLGFTPPGTKDILRIHEAIDPAPWPELDGVSPVAGTLKEFGIETAPPCVGNQLSVHREGVGAESGQKLVFYSFKNNSQSPCTLSGWPGYVLLGRSGRPLKAQDMGAEGVADEPDPVTLAPEGKAFFSVSYTPCSSTKSRDTVCLSSAKARISAPDTKRNFIIREVIALEGLTVGYGVIFSSSEIVSTLQELKEKP